MARSSTASASPRLTPLMCTGPVIGCTRLRSSAAMSSAIESRVRSESSASRVPIVMMSPGFAWATGGIAGCRRFIAARVVGTEVALLGDHDLRRPFGVGGVGSGREGGSERGGKDQREQGPENRWQFSLPDAAIRRRVQGPATLSAGGWPNLCTRTWRDKLAPAGQSSDRPGVLAPERCNEGPYHTRPQ